MTRIFIVVIFVLSMAHPSQAQENSKSKLTAIGELLEISGTDAVLDAQINTMAKEIMNLLFKKDFPKASQKAVDGLTQRMVDGFLVSKGDYYWRVAAVYDKYFTHDEILEMIEWYSSPLGKKTIKVMPKLLVESNEAGRRWGEEVGNRVATEMIEEFKKSSK